MSIKARERLLSILIFIGALALLFVVGYPQYKESLPSVVRIGVDRSYGSVLFYVAQEDTTRRYFALEKIQPEFVEMNSDPLQGIKDGLYDVAAVPWYWLMISPSYDGDTLKAFGSLELKSGRALDAIFVSTESKIQRLGDLKGKRLGYLARDEYIVNLFLPKMAEEDGITEVEKMLLQPGEVASALAERTVDALYVVDPYRGYMLYQGNKILFDGIISQYVITSMPYAAIVMRKNFVKDEDRLTAIRIKNAIEATLGYLARNPKVAHDMIAKINDWPVEDTLTRNLRIPEYQRLAEVNLRNVETFQTELVKRGIGTCGIRPTEFLFKNTDFVR